jgi:hypothetical protein
MLTRSLYPLKSLCFTGGIAFTMAVFNPFVQATDNIMGEPYHQIMGTSFIGSIKSFNSNQEDVLQALTFTTPELAKKAWGYEIQKALASLKYEDVKRERNTDEMEPFLSEEQVISMTQEYRSSFQEWQEEQSRNFNLKMSELTIPGYSQRSIDAFKANTFNREDFLKKNPD